MKSVPLISIGCPDPQATIRSIVAFYDDAAQSSKKSPLFLTSSAAQKRRSSSTTKVWTWKAW